ncbi:MAG: hypothetical protein ACQEQS_07130 [Thermodesulfobacteriota bacterium]
MNIKKAGFVFENLLFIIHLAFGTRHLGVNNRFWDKDDSVFCVPFYKGILTLPRRVKMMKKRAFMGFIPFEEAAKLFPDYALKYYGKKNEL